MIFNMCFFSNSVEVSLVVTLEISLVIISKFESDIKISGVLKRYLS